MCCTLVEPFAPLVLVLLVILCVLLTAIDRRVEDRVIRSASWVVAAAAGFLSMWRLGYPLEMIYALGSHVYFGAILGAGFRPGLMLQRPLQKDGSYWHYETWYAIAGWLGVAASATLYVACRLPE